MTNFGSVEFNGKTYHLTGEAQPTSSVLEQPYRDFNSVEEGDTYDFEMSAPAVDELGNYHTVFWIFQDTKGENGNSDYDSYDYDNVHDIA